jgi:hypothetical protein
LHVKVESAKSVLPVLHEHRWHAKLMKNRLHNFAIRAGKNLAEYGRVCTEEEPVTATPVAAI